MKWYDYFPMSLNVAYVALNNQQPTLLIPRQEIFLYLLNDDVFTKQRRIY